MKKEKPSLGDFFARYHKEQIQKVGTYIFSGIFALFLAFSFVSYSQDGNLQWLMANVGNLKKSPQYNADLILQRSGTSLKVIFGSEAEKVDTVEFTFLSDPLHFRKITSSDSRITVSSLGDGIFHIVKILDGQSIMAGSVVAELQADVDIGISINIVDTEFTSGGVKYSLTNKSE